MIKYIPLVWAQLFRNRVRTLLTLLSVIVAFVLFGMLDAVRASFTVSSEMDGVKRLIVTSRLSITQTLPISLLDRIKAVDGVREVAYAEWFGGIYQQRKNFFPSFAVSPNYFEVVKHMQVAPAQLKAFRQTRTAAIAGQTLVNKHGWKIGDTIPLQSSAFPRSGSSDWPLQLVGIFRSRDRNIAATEENQLLLNWSYFDEANDRVKGRVIWYVVVVDASAQSTAVARAIDALSANSDHETSAQNESLWMQSFVQQFADVGIIVNSIIGAVFFTLLLLTGNTMAQAVRERIPELATLKALGFSDRSVLWLVLAESLLLIGLGGLSGLTLARALLPLMSPRSQNLLPSSIPLSTWLVGLGLVLLISVVVGVLPALRAKRLNIVDALAGR